MLVKIITLKFDTLIETFDDSFLQDFIKDKEIISIKDYFFTKDGTPYLVFILTYRLSPISKKKVEKTKKEKKEAWRDLLDEEGYPLFNTLRNWRSERCKKDGVPPYIICTNEQLSIMVKNRPQSLNKLMEIDGFGKAKIKKYGDEILEVLKIRDEESKNTGDPRGENSLNNCIDITKAGSQEGKEDGPE